MNYNDVYGGPFLRVEDMPGDRDVTLIIKEVTITTFEDRKTHETVKQLVLKFHRTEKQLGLNKTNAKRIAHIHGEETDGWIDKPITLAIESFESFGEIKDGIRVQLRRASAPPASTTQQRAAAPATQQRRSSSDSLGSDPFDQPTPDLSEYHNEPIANGGPDFDDDIPF